MHINKHRLGMIMLINGLLILLKIVDNKKVFFSEEQQVIDTSWLRLRTILRHALRQIYPSSPETNKVRGVI